jgi:hypothetical protein
VLERLVQVAARAQSRLLGPAAWPAAFPWAGFLIAYLAGPAEAGEAFYDAASQIIPVLLLVLAVELRFFRLRSLPLPTFERDQSLSEKLEVAERSLVPLARVAVSLATLAVLAIGEFASLHPLSSGDADAGNAGLVYGALGAGVGAIAALAILGDAPERRGPDVPPRA